MNPEDIAIAEYFTALANGEQVTQTEVVEFGRDIWDSFNADRHPKLVKAQKTITKWYNERLPVGGGLILAGGYGCGKTHLALAIKQLYGMAAVFWEELDLCKTIQSSYAGGDRRNSEESIFSQCRRAKLLILDDLGAYETENMAWIQNIYRQLFNKRLEENKATLITTNLSVEGEKVKKGNKIIGVNASEFELRVGGKNFSRIAGQVDTSEYCVDLFGVPDYRLRNF